MEIIVGEILICNCCERIETSPYCVGDSCYDGCGEFVLIEDYLSSKFFQECKSAYPERLY